MIYIRFFFVLYWFSLFLKFFLPSKNPRYASVVSVAVPVTVTVTVSLTVLHEKEFYSTCVLWCSRSTTSTMFIDNKGILFLLIMPMGPFRGCIQDNGVTNSDVKKYVTK